MVIARSSPSPSSPSRSLTDEPADQPASPPPLDKSWLKEAFGDPFAHLTRSLKKQAMLDGLSEEEGRRFKLVSVIFKGGDDCRQEVLAMQLVTLFQTAFKQANLPLWLRPYSVLATGNDGGLVETVTDACSVDALKKASQGLPLVSIFETMFGAKGSPAYVRSQRNFVESMAAYSLVQYLLQLKDRHNGNILLDSAGHVIHIDFGFMLSSSPGGNLNFEKCPFKLTREYLDVMDAETFAYFKLLVIRGFLEVRKWQRPALLLVAVMQQRSELACFAGDTSCLAALSKRFLPAASEQECIQHAIGLVELSLDNWRTVQYDNYQTIVNNIW